MDKQIAYKQGLIMKSFDSRGSYGNKSGHKRHKSSGGGSSHMSSFSNEST